MPRHVETTLAIGEHIPNPVSVAGVDLMNTRDTDYYVFTSRRGDHPGRWSWEIRRKSKPLGVILTDDGFQSESAALFAGQRELAEFLSALAKDERQRSK